jgi:kumamolisin
VLSREDFAAAHGSSEEDLAVLAELAKEHQLTLGEHDRGRRSVAVSGRLADLAAAFGAELTMWDDEEGSQYRARTGPLQIEPAVAAVVTSVLGFDQRPQAHSQHRVKPTAATHYTPVQVAETYEYPTGVNGSGECVAIIELGGGFRPADLRAYFKELDIAEPSVTAVGVDGGANKPGKANGPDGEVMLDIEVVGSVAPGASIAVYFAPNTNQGFIDAVSSAVHDTTHRPSVVSISWGGPESTWTVQAMNEMEQAFQAGAAMGVTITVAAGDSGSTDGVSDGAQHVDFPASAPHALACGGTTLRAGSETVWNELASGEGAGGGGISVQFPVPSYQASAGVPVSANPGGGPGRGVPDVAGDADPATGYTIRVDGETTVIGGTSAVAPLWAGLFARLNQALGHPVGFAQPVLYQHPAAFTDITSGNNGAYQAGPGWDPCSGLGSPKGTAILAAFG